MPSDTHPSSAALASLRTLRLASLGEGATLLLLLFIAVPLKRMADWPTGVSIMGPIHGAAFLLYAALVLRHTGSLLTMRDTLALLLAAFVPFGAFLVGGIFKRKAQALG